MFQLFLSTSGTWNGPHAPPPCPAPAGLALCPILARLAGGPRGGFWGAPCGAAATQVRCGRGGRGGRPGSSSSCWSCRGCDPLGPASVAQAAPAATAASARDGACRLARGICTASSSKGRTSIEPLSTECRAASFPAVSSAPPPAPAPPQSSSSPQSLVPTAAFAPWPSSWPSAPPGSPALGRARRARAAEASHTFVCSSVKNALAARPAPTPGPSATPALGPRASCSIRSMSHSDSTSASRHGEAFLRVRAQWAARGPRWEAGEPSGREATGPLLGPVPLGSRRGTAAGLDPAAPFAAPPGVSGVPAYAPAHPNGSRTPSFAQGLASATEPPADANASRAARTAAPPSLMPASSSPPVRAPDAARSAPGGLPALLAAAAAGSGSSAARAAPAAPSSTCSSPPASVAAAAALLAAPAAVSGRASGSVSRTRRQGM